MSEPVITTLAVPVTHSTLLALKRLAKARRLKPEDIAGEVVDLHARQASDLDRKFADARAVVERRLASA